LVLTTVFAKMALGWRNSTHKSVGFRQTYICFAILITLRMKSSRPQPECQAPVLAPRMTKAGRNWKTDQSIIVPNGLMLTSPSGCYRETSTRQNVLLYPILQALCDDDGVATFAMSALIDINHGTVPNSS
jgi:hypothetical protein